LATFNIPIQGSAPTTGVTYVVSGNSNSSFNGTFTCTASSPTSITLSYSSNPGTYNTGATTITPSAGGSAITVTSFVSTVLGPYSVVFTIPTQGSAPATNISYVIAGNSNVNYNGTYNAIASSTTSITISYAGLLAGNPGSYGTGITTISPPGTTLTIGGTVTGSFAIGMVLAGNGIPGGTYIVSGSGSSWVVSSSTILPSTSINGTLNKVILDRGPDGSTTGGQAIRFAGINYTYWKLLVPGKKWSSRWTTTGGNLSITSASGSGSIVTVTYAPQTSPLFVQGQSITITRVLPTSYNGTFTVLTSTTTQTQFTSTTTATYSSGGIIVLPQVYRIGDIVVWGNGTYSCVQENTAIHVVNAVGTVTNSTRPDYDTTNTFWSLLVAQNQRNSLQNPGDIETFTTGPGYSNISIGTNTYNLRVNTNVPNWQQINVVPGVYYVDVNNGVDDTLHGSTWDRPWKTIQYACTTIGKGFYFTNAAALLQANKAWMITEMYQWMIYQVNNNIAPFSSSSLFDPINTQADAAYLVDAVIYDMERGGNSQIVAATLRWFYYGSSTQFINQLVESSIAYFAPAQTYLQSLMLNAVNQTAPAVSYQTLNGITGVNAVSQYTNVAIQAEAGINTEITSLMSIPITATTNQNTYAVPASNSGLTTILNIKTGTYSETLPIVVPENCSIVGDELRSTSVQPLVSLQFYATSTNSSTNVVTVTSTTGLADQMPIQFISNFINNASTSFDLNILPGQTYYILGSSITPTGFQIVNAPTQIFTGTIVNGSNIIQNASQITKIVVGMNVSGTGIPLGTTVTAVNQGISSVSTITLSSNVTASGIFLTFTATGNVVTLAGGSGNMLCYAGDCLKDMWYMTNGTTMRNLSNFGLLGMISQTDAYSIARPTGGRYTSLYPGNGPNDTTAWIFRRSPYIQNVTNFGTGCIGLMVDGSLHNGGNKSIVANDYTQVLSDGIGVWVANSGAKSECVSVFSYYNYIGHFASGGGRIRSTNGNSSYGTFGVVSEGYDTNEVPATGTIFNQSIQVQASVSQAFGTTNNILKLNYSNAGSGYYYPETNMIQYSNNFVASVWTNDGNISFIKNEVAPTGYTEAWLLTGASSTAGTGYIQQGVSINPSGAFYSAVSGTTQNSAPGAGATFDITVTATAYQAVVHTGSAGSNYTVGNTILIKGSVLGGVDGTNDCTLTVGSLSGTGILTLSAVTGTVPAGSAQTYTISMFVYPGTSATCDLQAVFSGSSTVVSGISYNVSSNTVTPYAGTATNNSTNAGFLPVNYGAQKTLTNGWYKIWFAVYDTTGLNNTITMKFLPQGANAPKALTYTIIYGAQLELSGNTPAPNFYLETTNSMFTAAANFEVVGAGSGALLSGDEIRSGSIFNARIITDANGYTGGIGYATASNTAQGGAANTIQISNADAGTYNYVGMRVFVQSGTGAGQFGYITYYNGGATTVNGVAAKTALVCRDDFEQISIVQTTYSNVAANNLLSIGSGTDLSKLYVNQAIQFTPTYYTSPVTSTSVGQVTAIATQGGIINVIQMTSVASLAVNMPITFVGSGFNITAGYLYYIVQINPVINGTTYNNCIQISTAQYGTAVQLSTVNASANITMVMNYPNYSGYLSSTSGVNAVLNVTSITGTTGVFGGSGFNLSVGQQVNITGIFSSGTIVGYVEGTTYYVIGSPTSTSFQLSATPNGSAITTTTSSGTITGITVTAINITTANIIPNIAIQFTGTALGGVTLGSTYYIQEVIDSNNFTISSQQVVVSAPTTTGGATNTIQATTSSMVSLNPVVFGGTITDASIFANTTYWISNIVDSGDFQISTSIIRTTAVSTTITSNVIQISTSVTNFVQYQPIIFYGFPTGSTFGGIVPNTVYYILTINTAANTIVISSDKVNPFPLTNATGQIFVKTCPAPLALGGSASAMTATTTGSTLVVSNSVGNTGIMNSTYQTSLIGGVNSYTVYYVTAITPGANPTISVSTSLGGTPITLTNGLGNMQLCASGWDNINPGTPSVPSLDSTSAYYIEPRATFAAPSWSQTTGTLSQSLAGGAVWQAIAYGNNYFLAVPNSGTTGALSTNGQNWTTFTLPNPATTINWSSIAYGNYYWIALGSPSTGSQIAAYSNSYGTGWRTTAMPSSASPWSSIVYGNGRFVAISSGTTNAAYSTNFGQTWTSSSTGLLATKTWVGLSYGLQLFLAIASDGTGAWSYDGNIWQATSLPANTAILSTVVVTGGAGTFSCSTTTSQLVVGQTVVVSGTNTASGPGTIANGTYYISSTNGKTTFTLSSTNPSALITPISTSAGNTNQTFTVGVSNYNGLAYGDNRFLAIQNGTGLYSAYSFNGITWYQSQTYLSATSVVYGQGTFVAVNSSSAVEYNSHAGVLWYQRTLPYGNINALGFGFNSSNVGVFPTLSGQGGTLGNVTFISEGTRALGRATVTSGVITALNLFETGSNYTSSPAVSFVDFNSQVTALVNARYGNGSLSNPSFISRGTGYNTTSTQVSISGNGFADTYQTGLSLIINNLSTLPLVGSNLSIAGNSQVYKVTSAVAVFGTTAPFIEANVQVSPAMTTALSPTNGTAVSLRQLYSQVRLTNHDFLSVGSGNLITSNYPNINEVNALPGNEAIEVNQGHVFYTSTDENGNFLVGSLFGVQQATGTVTLSATQFGLQGLQTLSLGGIAVGGNQVVVTQFSTDPTFVANSDAIIPTQRAIKSFLAGRLSQGGSNTFTGTLIAGTVSVGGSNFMKSTVPAGQVGSSIKFQQKVNFAVVPGSLSPSSNLNINVDGNMAAFDFFMRAGSRRSTF